MSLRDLLFGRPLRSDEESEEQVGTAQGVAVLGLDALASSAYGPEALLTVLLPLGTVAVVYVAPLVCVIVVVLLAVYFSYRQTIAAYPNGGGSFTVASQNLGRVPGVLAASALALDYILNVAVAIAAGVGAVVSAMPSLLPHTLTLSLALLVLITVLNLRGIRQAGLLLFSPTWLFVALLGLTIVIGIAKAIASGGHPHALAAPPPATSAAAAVSVWLLVRAFANGTTAMTGVEAVSNGVPLFKPPTVQHARRALTLIIAILAVFLVGIAYLCRAYHVVASAPGRAGYQSVLSQLVAAVSGRGVFYYAAMTAILAVLCLSANTSFADFPRLCRLLALDAFLPPSFAHRGARLVYTEGIVVLAVLAGILLIVFGGITDRLIPLFAVGALTAFTMSQWGMVAHWRKTRGPHARRSMAINAAGATATTLTVLVVLISKFTEGAWVTVLVIGAFVVLLMWRRARSERLAREIGTETGVQRTHPSPLEIDHPPPPIVVVPIYRLDPIARKSLQLAVTMSDQVEAVQVLTGDPDCADLRPVWRTLVEAPVRRSGHTVPRLVALASAYREFFTPFLEHVRQLVAANPQRYIAVIVPELVTRHWYHALFRTRAVLLKTLLRHRCGPYVVIIDAPWHVDA